MNFKFTKGNTIFVGRTKVTPGNIDIMPEKTKVKLIELGLIKKIDKNGGSPKKESKRKKEIK